ncbi:unnamed protein product [Adineta ricciae]|uniref:K Homology domain-containing protein n=1 Tax=Adineta ricciae TaxID=249248 RepID=A0A814NUG2_ADIRI|nr:unnamed protein product [Adineta ricciae]CAF1096807.1 unnamed protein product [Adineta ricciae]
MISPTPVQIMTTQPLNQTESATDSAELSTVTSSSPLSTETDPRLIDKPEYLSQLLKDKRQLAVLPSNLFIHMERLLDQEINKVRVNLYSSNCPPQLILPEITGERKIFQEKIYIPVQQYPDFNFVGRLLGPRGMTSKQLEAQTDCKIMIRGRGSMRDKQKEELHRGKPSWEHLDDDLHVLIQCEDYENRAKMKLERAKEEINKLLIPSTDGDDYIKKKQLAELAIINGTYRDSNFLAKRTLYTDNQIPIGAPLIITPHIPQAFLSESFPSTVAPNLFTPTHASSISQTSFISNQDPNLVQILAPLPTFDQLGASFVTNGTHLVEYPNQSTYPVFTTPTSTTGVSPRSMISNPSRHATSSTNASLSARYQPYTIQSPHIKRP